MGLVVGKWQFAGGAQPPSVIVVAERLAAATGLQVVLQDGTSAIQIPTLRESLFDVENSGTEIVLYGYIPAHPYVWENLDQVLTELGGLRVIEQTCWCPTPRFYHLRRPWNQLSKRQKFLLSLPTLGASRIGDRLI